MKVLVLLANGFEEVEVVTQVDFLRRAGVTVVTAAIGNEIMVTGNFNIPVKADALLSEVNSDDFDMVALETITNQYLGGDSSLACSAKTQSLIDEKVIELVRLQHDKAKGILLENKDKLNELAAYLYEKETITGEEFLNKLKENSPSV